MTLKNNLWVKLRADYGRGLTLCERFELWACVKTLFGFRRFSLPVLTLFCSQNLKKKNQKREVKAQSKSITETSKHILHMALILLSHWWNKFRWIKCSCSQRSRHESIIVFQSKPHCSSHPSPCLSKGKRGHWTWVFEHRSNMSRNSISSSQVAHIVFCCWYYEVETLEGDKAAHLCQRSDLGSLTDTKASVQDSIPQSR